MGASTKQHWAIVGGGILGLTLALRLAERGAAVTIIEEASQLGGLASAWSIGDITWDRHYHVTLYSDTHLRALLAEMGLEREIEWVETRSACYASGRLHSVSSTIDLARLPLLGLLDKIRLGMTIMYGARIKDWKRLEQVPVADWLTRWSGRRTFERFWLPLLRAKLGERYRDASAAFIWATIQRLYAARRTGLKKEMFGYVPGGYARILARFSEVLRQRNVRLVLGRRVESIAPISQHLEVTYGDGDSTSFDRVVVTTPAPVARRICKGLSNEESSRLAGVSYQGLVCASLVLTRPLGGYYLTYITDSGFPFTAVVEMTALVDPSHFDQKTLVYLPRYADPSDRFFGMTDREVIDRFIGALRRMYPDLTQDQIIAARVSRVPSVFAIPTTGFSNRLPDMVTSVLGLYIVQSAHIVNGTLNVNETVKLARDALNRLVGTDGMPSMSHGGARPSNV